MSYRICNIMKKLFLFFVFVGFAVSSVQAQNQAICGGSNATITPAASATTPTLNPGNAAPANGVWVVTPSVTTSYTILTTVATPTPNIFTTNTVVNTVTVNPMPKAIPSFTQSTCTNSNNCFNLNLTFSPANPAPSYTVLWSNGGQGQPNIPNCITNSSTQFSCCGYIFPGVYAASVTADGGCGNAWQFTIDPIPAPATFTLNPAGNTLSVTCFQPTLDITASNPNNTYTWSVPAQGASNDQSVTVTSVNQGTIGVIASNTLSGCTYSTSISLAVNTLVPNSIVQPTFQTINCTSPTQIVTLTAVSPTLNFIHEVTPPIGGLFTSLNNTVAYLPSVGDYTYTLRNLSNGCSVSKTFSVASTSGFPTFTITSNQEFTIGCSSKSVTTINIPTVIPGSAPGAGVSYAWQQPGSVGAPSFSLGDNVRNVFIPGTWTVLVQDMGNNCITPLLMSIVQTTVGPKIDTIYVARDWLTCENPSVALVAQSSVPNISPKWTFTNVTVQNISALGYTVNANLANPTQTLANNTNYVFSLTDNNSACISTKTIVIRQNVRPPTAHITSITRSLTCNVKRITLNNSSLTNTVLGFPSPQTPIGYIWQGPSPQTSIAISTVYDATVPGEYTLIAKDPNNGCTASTNTMVIGNNLVFPDVSSTGTTVIECGQTSDTLRPTISSNTTGLVFQWTSPFGIPTGNPFLKNLSISIPASYSVIAEYTANGCKTPTPVVFTAINGYMTAEIEPDKVFGYAPLEVSFINNSKAGVITSSIETVWNFGNSSTLTTQQVSITPKEVYKQPGVYVVTAYSRRGSCLASTTKTITVEVPSNIVIPNVFTPNDDKVNDLFFLKASSLAEISMSIYDRWGNKVYELLNATNGNVAWDGKNQAGNDCAEGTYYYILKATGKDDKAYEYKGNISLFR